MTTNPSAPNGAQQWLLAMAGESPRSLPARLLPDSIGPVGLRMEKETKGFTDQQMMDWLFLFSKEFPDHFTGPKYAYDGDLTELTAAELHAVSNGEDLPYRRRKRK